MAETITCKIKPYIQPFERELALAELSTIADSKPQSASKKNGKELNLNFSVETDVPADELAGRLSYWETVESGKTFLTDQILRESTVNLVRNGVSLEQIKHLVTLNIEKGIPNRRCLRYGTHGIHEYRGKFFPQLVRALINIAGVPHGGLVADPMSGSGTTLAEAILAGCDSIALDMNPLSVLIGRNKCELLTINPDELINSYRQIFEELNNRARSAEESELKYFNSLPELNREYLINWFSEKTLVDLETISQIINEYETPAIRNLFRLTLSNILRSVSWQKESDLRVRKEIKPDSDIKTIEKFLGELGKSVKTVSSFLYQMKDAKIGSFELKEGNACNIKQIWADRANKVDAVITSPPYATALPYLDTDRLSILYLGLLTRKEQRVRDQDMIGNREITEKLRRQYWQDFQEIKKNLPNSIVSLIEKIDQLNSESEVGFRRKNLSALLSKYFLDMKEVLEGIYYILKPGASAFVVVGNNHTVAGGEKVEIETAYLLSDIAELLGFKIGKHIPMDMLVSREIYKKNAVASEIILCLQKPE